MIEMFGMTWIGVRYKKLYMIKVEKLVQPGPVLSGANLLIKLGGTDRL